MSITTSKAQPALIGGVVLGVLSGLPIISAGNICCCAWLLAGGLAAAYVLQQNEPAPITNADGAQIGLLAGLTGAVVYLIISIPITFFIAPMQRLMLQQLLERANQMPPELRDYVGSYIGGFAGIFVSFVFMVVMGAIFATLGGLVGAIVFRKPLAPPAGPIDVTPPPAS